MAIEISQINNFDLRSDLICLKQQWTRSNVIKSLFFAAILAAGIAAVVLLGANINFLAIGIGIILVSSFAIYHSFNHYRHTKNIFNRAAAAIDHS
jgi:hypothetical protein